MNVVEANGARIPAIGLGTLSLKDAVCVEAVKSALTAERYGKEDQSWYMAYIPDPKRPIVIAVTVEQGGFGAETAAPIARLMAAQHFGKPEKFVVGSSKTF